MSSVAALRLGQRVLLSLTCLVFMFAGAACGPGPDGDPARPQPNDATLPMNEGDRVVVVLDVFSGVPNPFWVLTWQEALEWDQLLQDLPEGTADQALPPGLGYRGFIVTQVQGVEFGCRYVFVYGESVTMGNDCDTPRFVDTTRSLEQFLLRTSRDHIDESLHQQLETELGAP